MWYSILVLFSFFFGIEIFKYVYKTYNKKNKKINFFIFYIFFFTLFGARLGDIIFYNWDYYSVNLIEIFLPIKFNSSWKFIGYNGFSYHGAIFGVIFIIVLYSGFTFYLSFFPFSFKFIRKKFFLKKFLWFSTSVSLGFLMGLFVRIGNFVNSEIIGTRTENVFGVLFSNNIVNEIKINYNISFVKLNKIDNILVNKKTYQPILIDILFDRFDFKENEIRDFIEFNIKKIFLKNKFIDIYEKKNYPILYNLKKKKNSFIIQIQTLCIPRHPVQLYEFFSYLIIFIFIFFLLKKKSKKN